MKSGGLHPSQHDRHDDDGARPTGEVPTRPLDSPPARRGEPKLLDERYGVAEPLAIGGMGEVYIARDARLNRRVAVKVARPQLPTDLGRFEREYQLQAQLDHPGVVPVHDAGTTSEGDPFFVMQWVRGASLESVLSRLASGDPIVSARFSRVRLLSLFVTICQSVHYAHTNGVIHRDLKPANIMLGEFGEVYVIDWGIAKLRRDAPDGRTLAERAGIERSHLESIPPTPLAEGSTHQGELLGSPGYMAPEQLSNAARVDARADVYALGAILFELLTMERLHRGSSVDALDATLKDASARVRSVTEARRTPPELVAICLRATALDPKERYATLDLLIDDVQRFLDGDRDVQARATIAASEVEKAGQLLAESAALTSQSEAVGSRERALRHAGRALALDPTNQGVQDLVLRAMFEALPDTEVPESVANAVEAAHMRVYRRAARAGAQMSAAFLPLMGLLALTHPRQPVTLALWAVAQIAFIGLLFLNTQVRERTRGLYFVTLGACLASLAIASRVIGPFVTTPGLITVAVALFVMLGKRQWQTGTVALGLATIVSPIVLEQAGVLAPTTMFDGAGMHVHSVVVPLDARTTLLTVTGTTIGIYLLLAVASSYFRQLLTSNAERAQLERWKLTALLPSAAMLVEPPPPSVDDQRAR
ncbi:MAG: protein kinase [Polyangiaceae bacterium]